jgi:hypothetical protein
MCQSTPCLINSRGSGGFMQVREGPEKCHRQQQRLGREGTGARSQRLCSTIECGHNGHHNRVSHLRDSALAEPVAGVVGINRRDGRAARGGGLH